MRPALILLFACACQTARPILAEPPEGAAGALMFEDVRIFDGVSETLSAPSDVLVEGGRIAAIGPHGLHAQSAQHIDGHGKTLLPGLIDCHVHLGAGDGGPPWAAKRPNVDAQSAALIYSGVTTILAAMRDADYAELSKRIARGELAGPRIIPSSRALTARDGHPVPFFKAALPWPISSAILRGRVRQLDTPADARAAVDQEVADGARFVKVMYDDIPPGSPHLSRELLKAIVDEARAKGARVSVHIGSPQDALEAVEAGAALLMHLPADEPLTAEQAQILAKSGVPIVTTARVYEVLNAGDHDALKFSPLEKAVMPPGIEKDFASRPANFHMDGFPDSYFASFPQRNENGVHNAHLLAEAGALLVAGTDSGLPGVFHGPALHRELQALVAIGLSPARVLRMATSDAARVLDPHADYGRIAVGQRADLLLIDGDPLADISATEHIAGVWQDGRAVRRKWKSSLERRHTPPSDV